MTEGAIKMCIDAIFHRLVEEVNIENGTQPKVQILTDSPDFTLYQPRTSCDIATLSPLGDTTLVELHEEQLRLSILE